MDNKTRYKKFCQQHKDIPIFSQPYWLDAISENWDVILIEKNGEIIASWPYSYKKKFGFKFITTPPLTQKLGPYIIYPEQQKYSRRLSYEHKILMQLLEQMPEFDFFSQNLSEQITNILPFHWQGFKTQVKYTYIIKSQDIEKSFSEIEKKSKIRKALKKGIRIETSEDIKLIYNLVKQSFNRHKKKFHVNLNQLIDIDNVLKKLNLRRIQIAYDKQNNIVAANYLIWDNKRVYNLLSGIDQKYSHYSAPNLLIWKSIEFAIKENKIFDFEGSMNKNIEQFFRSFGARQEIFFNIYKTRKKIHCIINCIKKVIY